MPTTFFILAGEASGDQHAAKLVLALKNLMPDARFVGMGGERLAAAGMTVLKDLSRMQVTGFWEVAKQYGLFKRVFYTLLDQVKQQRPNALICIDYPGFNLRFAAAVRKLGIPVLYYIVPQVWAWKPMRAKKMARSVDRCYTVFEFEPPFFQKFGLKTRFVGHPLMDEPLPPAQDLRARLRPLLLPDDKLKLIGLFPGSRENELRHHLAPMVGALGRQGDINRGAIGWVRLAGERSEEWLQRAEEICGQREEVQARARAGGFHSTLAAVWPEAQAIASLETRGTNAPPCRLPELAAAADFNVVKSGTSTLEAGLMGQPLCALYRGSAVSYALAHLLVNIPVFSLVNIVLGRYVVPELLQNEVNSNRIAEEISRGLTDQRFRDAQQKALAELPKKLGGPGASQRTAEAIVGFLQGKE